MRGQRQAMAMAHEWAAHRGQRRAWQDWFVMGDPDLADLVEYRSVDGRPTVWNRSTLSDPNPFPAMRLWSR